MLSEFRSTNVTWDKATSRIYSPVTANESDENGRKLVVQIVNGGKVEDLTGAALHLYWETIDKVHDGLDVFKAVDLKKGAFELSYTTGMLSNKGVLNANLVLVDTTGRVVSERFKITVTEGINDGSIQSENSFTTLTQALIDIGNLEQNYAPRLNDLTAQLQHKANEANVDFRQTSGKGTKSKDPTVIFVSDDVRLQDKSLLLPIMQRYSIPFVTAISPNRNINRHEFGNVYLTVDEAKELQDTHGWEVVSHTWNHEHLPELNDEDLDYTLRHSREWMIENGFNGYDFLMYPFGEYDERVKRVTAKYYKAARTTGTPNYPPENKYPLSNYQLSTRFISQTVQLETIKDDVSRLIRDDGLLIIFFHGQEIEMWGREAFLEEVISYVKSEETAGRLKIKNFRQAFETQENIIDQVNYTDKYDDQFVIGANGKVQSNIARTKLLKPNSVTSTTLPELYPHDFISMCTISNTTGGFPILGTLVTHRFSNNENTVANAGYTHQTLYGYNSSRVMTRNFMGAWTPFSDSGGSSGGGIITGSGYNGETSPATFNMGISHHTIGSGSAGIPITTGGIMKTVKVSSYDFWYQELKPVISNDLWRRYATSATTWGTFVKVTSASGTTSKRPTGISIGYSYFDTTIGKPVWLKSIGVWVDSTGATV